MTRTGSSWSLHPHSESNACMLRSQLASSTATQPRTQNLKMTVPTFRLCLRTSMKPHGKMYKICIPKSTLFILHCTWAADLKCSWSPVSSCLPGEMALSGGRRVGESGPSCSPGCPCQFTAGCLPSPNTMALTVTLLLRLVGQLIQDFIPWLRVNSSCLLLLLWLLLLWTQGTQ